MCKDWILKAPQVVLRTGNIYVPIQVSIDKYSKILPEHYLDRESSQMRGEIIFAVEQENQSWTMPAHTDKYGFGLNGRSPCTASVIRNLLPPSTWAAACLL